MRGWAAGSALLVAVLTVGCGSSSTAPTPPPVTTTTTTTIPAVIQVIESAACPTSILGVDLPFYRQLACNGFESPGALQPTRRWTRAPSIYLKTVDEAGAPIDAVTLDTVQNAMIGVAPAWTGGKFSIVVTRGTETRENTSGWVTVKWSAKVESFCGNSTVGVDGGAIVFSPQTADCSCGGSTIRPRSASHELGHAFGYWHTDNPDDLMSNLPNQIKPCDQQPSARELTAAAAHYR